VLYIFSDGRLLFKFLSSNRYAKKLRSTSIYHTVIHLFQNYVSRLSSQDQDLRDPGFFLETGSGGQNDYSSKRSQIRLRLLCLEKNYPEVSIDLMTSYTIIEASGDLPVDHFIV